MSLKISQVVTKNHLLRGISLKNVFQYGKFEPIAQIPAVQMQAQLYPKQMTPEKLYFNDCLFKTTFPLIIEPPKINNIVIPNVSIKKEIVYRPFNNVNLQYEDLPSTKEIDEPNSSSIVEKKAARLIVIRRKKMKRHQLRKLRKRMKFEWAKVRQKRELKKEKEFQAELIGKIKEAEKFDAQTYCTEKLQKANAELLPKFWRGKRLPAFVIKDLVKQEQKKIAEREENAIRRKNMSLKVSDYP